MFMEKPKSLTITFTKENLKHPYSLPRDCPIYHALADAGVPVREVWGEQWVDNDGVEHHFSEALQRVSNILEQTMTDMRRKGRRALIDKEVVIDLV